MQHEQAQQPRRPRKNDTVIEGVPIRFVACMKEGTAICLPGFGIYVGNKKTAAQSQQNDEYLRHLLMHEFGHILQARRYGLLFYYFIVGPTSLLSAVWSRVTFQFHRKFGGEKPGVPIRHYRHNHTWTEWDANRRASTYFSETNWREDWFPTNL